MSIPYLDDKEELTTIFEGCLEDLYYRYDTMITNSIEFEEFKDMYDTIGEQITAAEFDGNILKNYCSFNKGLTLKGFKAFFKNQI